MLKVAYVCVYAYKGIYTHTLIMRKRQYKRSNDILKRELLYCFLSYLQGRIKLGCVAIMRF